MSPSNFFPLPHNALLTRNGLNFSSTEEKKKDSHNKFLILKMSSSYLLCVDVSGYKYEFLAEDVNSTELDSSICGDE